MNSENSKILEPYRLLLNLADKMGTNIFMNSENSKILEPYRLLLNLADKINLKRNNKYVALSNVLYM